MVSSKYNTSSKDGCIYVRYIRYFFDHFWFLMLVIKCLVFGHQDKRVSKKKKNSYIKHFKFYTVKSYKIKIESKKFKGY